jgi:GNAT superfamily N-acetyltransferase
MELLMLETNGIKYARETLTKVRKEIEYLIHKNWEETSVYKDTLALDPDWDTYEAAEKTGMLGIYTAREQEKLVGYLVVIANNHMHYKGHIFASNDILYLDPDYRKGFTGIKLIKFVEEDLKKMGVSVFNINTTPLRPFGNLLERLGFNLIEQIYSKKLG